MPSSDDATSCDGNRCRRPPSTRRWLSLKVQEFFCWTWPCVYIKSVDVTPPCNLSSHELQTTTYNDNNNSVWQQTYCCYYSAYDEPQTVVNNNTQGWGITCVQGKKQNKDWDTEAGNLNDKNMNKLSLAGCDFSVLSCANVVSKLLLLLQVFFFFFVFCL